LPQSLIEPVIHITYFGNNINEYDLKSSIFAELADLPLSGRMLDPSETENQLSCTCTLDPVSPIHGPTPTLQPVINRAELD